MILSRFVFSQIARGNVLSEKDVQFQARKGKRNGS